MLGKLSVANAPQPPQFCPASMTTLLTAVAILLHFFAMLAFVGYIIRLITIPQRSLEITHRISGMCFLECLDGFVQVVQIHLHIVLSHPPLYPQGFDFSLIWLFKLYASEVYSNFFLTTRSP